MEEAAYPELEAHRQQHCHLLSQVYDMELRTEIGEKYVPVELSHLLYTWLVDHIQTDDRKFGKFMAAGRK